MNINNGWAFHHEMLELVVIGNVVIVFVICLCDE